jgi:hypothetical protein
VRPVLQYSILCDGVQSLPENGKPSYLGVFEVVMASAFPATHPEMFIINRWSGGTGEHVEKIRIESPDGRKVIMDGPETRFLLANRGKTHTVTLRVEGLTFDRPGTYWVQVFLDESMIAEYPLTAALMKVPRLVENQKED